MKGEQELSDDFVLVLRTCRSDMTSPSPEANGFKYPESGYVEAPDWDGGQKVCGGKLHGALWGEGDGNLFCWDADAKWLVLKVRKSVLVVFADKCGFQGRRSRLLWRPSRGDVISSRQRRRLEN